ncbi:MAG: hypothetical protein PVG16_01410, partial [Chromatiales bacterium]
AAIDSPSTLTLACETRCSSPIMIKDSHLVGIFLQGFQLIPIPGGLFVSYSDSVVAWIDMDFVTAFIPRGRTDAILITNQARRQISGPTRYWSGFSFRK